MARLRTWIADQIDAHGGRQWFIDRFNEKYVVEVHRKQGAGGPLVPDKLSAWLTGSGGIPEKEIRKFLDILKLDPEEILEFMDPDDGEKYGEALLGRTEARRRAMIGLQFHEHLPEQTRTAGGSRRSTGKAKRGRGGQGS